MKAAALLRYCLKNTQEGSAYVLGFLILWYYRRGCDPVRLSDDLPYRLGAPSRKSTKDIAGDEDPQKAEYRRKKRGGQKAAAQKAKEKEKQLKRQKRVDKLNHYRAINGKGPVGMDGKPIDKKKSKGIYHAPGTSECRGRFFIFASEKQTAGRR